jgi:methylenetetrahydrofolate--tRNA-(uracil-5-)-methyltransferase
LKVRVIGAGLAGSEAAWQLAQAGIEVEIYEMRPQVMTSAHRTGLCAELVCSNSLRGAQLTNAVGLLKEELRCWRSLIMQAAVHAQVPAGGALAVDRAVFSRYIDEHLRKHPLISFCSEEVKEIPETSGEAPAIIAAGPLVSASLARAIQQLTGANNLAFFDAISPIIVGQSIDQQKLFRQSRYDKGSGEDYLNIALNEEQYYAFVKEVGDAQKSEAHAAVESDAAEELRPFEGCMPIEDMAARGQDTLLFGPLKPVGLTDPETGKRPYAVVQLRQDDQEGSLWNMVGMQTRMKHPEQQRIFRMLPGLENAEFVRLGSVHRNTFINSPKCLSATLEFRTRPGLFFAGQITGSEGYVESTAGGLAAGINASQLVRGRPLFVFPQETAIGALTAYISDPSREDFQPMNVSFGLMPCYLSQERRGPNGKKISKKDLRLKVAESALKITAELAAKIGAAAVKSFP